MAAMMAISEYFIGGDVEVSKPKEATINIPGHLVGCAAATQRRGNNTTVA